MKKRKRKKHDSESGARVGHVNGCIRENYKQNEKQQHTQKKRIIAVGLDRHSTTVTKVIEGCVHIRWRFHAFFSLEEGSGTLLSALRSLLRVSSLSFNTTKIRKLIRPRGGEGIRARTLRTHKRFESRSFGTRSPGCLHMSKTLKIVFSG